MTHNARWQKRGLGIVLLLLVLILLMSACSSSGGGATPAHPELTAVTLQLPWVTQAQFAGYYVALDKGWYREEGLDLTIRPGAPDIYSTDVVLHGGSDFGSIMLADLARVISEEDAPLVSIAQIQQENGLLLLARKSSGIETPADFVDQRVGIWLGSWETQFDALLALEGLSRQDFELVAQGYEMTPFIAGELDVASAMIYNEYHTVLESGLAAEELNIIDYADYGLDFPGDTLFTTREMITQQPELAGRMLHATLRGWKYAIDHPEETVRIVLKYDQTDTQKYEHQLAMMEEIAKLVRVNTVRPLGYTERQDVLRMLKALTTYGVITENLAPEQVYTNEIWEGAQLDATQ
ncbi:MAG: ABC transporter substrate-binding protein [Chloroflexota bacterium]|nr:ABC transporter substrate-binding protein [Chloroflexota bacterium]